MSWLNFSTAAFTSGLWSRRARSLAASLKSATSSGLSCTASICLACGASGGGRTGTWSMATTATPAATAAEPSRSRGMGRGAACRGSRRCACSQASSMATSISGESARSRALMASKARALVRRPCSRWWRSSVTAPALGGRRRSTAAASATTTAPAATARISQARRLESTSGKTLRTASVPAATASPIVSARGRTRSPRASRSRTSTNVAARRICPSCFVRRSLTFGVVLLVRRGSSRSAAARDIVPADGSGARKFLRAWPPVTRAEVRHAREERNGVVELTLGARRPFPALDETVESAVTWLGRASWPRAPSWRRPSWRRAPSWRRPSWRRAPSWRRPSWLRAPSWRRPSSRCASSPSP